MSSDEELIIIDKSPTLPTLKEIDRVVRRIVIEARENGSEPKDVKLKDCIERLQCWHEPSIMKCQESIKAICRSLRAIQQAMERAPKVGEGEEPLMYYKGNISSRDLDCLNGRNWLNDCIINRYMELMVAHYHPAPFVAISSFFLETLESKKTPEKLPDMTNKIALIPCCLNSHWSLIVALEPHKSLVIFSSMNNQIDEDDLPLFMKLRTHLSALFHTAWDLRIHTKLKPQNNSDDCGVFVLAYARCFMEGGSRLPLVGQNHTKALRKLFMEEIKDAKLRDWSDLFKPKPRRIIKLPT